MTDFKNTPLHRGFATDKTAEADGIWRTHHETGIRVKIRRATHPIYRNAMRKQAKRYRHLAGNLPAQVEQEIKFKAAAEAMVTDWDMPGVPFSQEVVLAAFNQYPDFYEWCDEEANAFENYRLTEVEADAAPLSPSSDGSLNGATPQSSHSSNDEPGAAHL